MNALIDFILLIPYSLFYILESFVKWIIPRRWRYKNVSDDIVLITGGSRGIGQQLAYKFAKLKSTVIIWGTNKKGLAETVSEVNKLGGKIFSYECDVTKREEVYKTAQKIREEVGVVTMLVNNAGIVTGKPILEAPDDMIQRTFDVNVMAHFWTVKAFLPDMIKYEKGHIVTISSVLGHTGADSLVDYCASKYAEIGFDEALHFELRTRGVKNVTTTVVSPGFVDTGMFQGFRQRFIPALTPEYVADEIISGILANERAFFIPCYFHVLAVFKVIVPWKMYLVFCEKIVQFHKAMFTFIGRQPLKQN